MVGRELLQPSERAEKRNDDVDFGGFNRLGLLLKIARNLFEHLPDLGPHQSMMGPSSRID